MYTFFAEPGYLHDIKGKLLFTLVSDFALSALSSLDRIILLLVF